MYMYRYVCLYIYIYIYACVCVYIYISVCVYVCTYITMHIHRCIYIHYAKISKLYSSDYAPILLPTRNQVSALQRFRLSRLMRLWGIGP